MATLFLVTLDPGPLRVFVGRREAGHCARDHMRGRTELVLEGDDGSVRLWGPKGQDGRHYPTAEVTPIAPPRTPRAFWGPWLHVAWRRAEPRLFAWRWMAKAHDWEGKPHAVTLPADEPPPAIDLYGAFLWFYRVLTTSRRATRGRP